MSRTPKLDWPSPATPLDLHAVAQQREALRRRAAHPRLAAGWNAFVESQRRLAAEPANDPGKAAAQAESLAFGAALTDDAVLGAAAAARLALAADGDAPWMGADHKRHYPELEADLYTAERTKAMVAACSWARPWLDGPTLAAVKQAVANKGGRVIAADAARGAWWATAINSNWCAVLHGGLAFAALLVAEDQPRVARSWLATAVDALRAMLDLAGEEGAGIEGPGYWIYCFTSVLHVADALARLGAGELMAHPFWSRAAEYALHLALPDLSGWTNLGDCGYPGLGGAQLFAALASRAGDGRGQWLANRLLAVGSVGPRELILYDPDLPETSPEREPPCRLFTSAQIASLRSDWGPDATHFVLKGGSNAWSHCHLDLNSFVLTARGERLAVDPGPWPYTPDYWTSVEPPVSTAWHNTLTVDGGDQRQPPRYRLSFDLPASGDAWCRLEGFADAPWAALVRGDATVAYGDTLRRFVRHVVYLKPDLALIYDDVVVKECRAQRHLQWLLHSAAPLEPRGDALGVVVRGAKAELWVTVALPEGGAGKLLPDRTGPPERPGAPIHAWALRPHWHHLWNVSPTRSPHPHWDPRGRPRLFGPEYSFAVLLEVTAPGEEPRWSLAAEGDQVIRVFHLSDGVTRVTAAFNPHRVPFAAADVETDAEQLLLRRMPGRPADCLALAPTRLRLDGETLVESYRETYIRSV